MIADIFTDSLEQGIGEWGGIWEDLPRHLKTYKLCLSVVERHGWLIHIESFIRCIKDYKMCLISFEDTGLFYNIPTRHINLVENKALHLFINML